MERGLEVARGGGGGWEVTVNGPVSFWSDGNVLEVGNGDDCNSEYTENH